MSGIYGNIANQYPTTIPTTGNDTNINSLNTNLDNIQTKSNILLAQQEEIQKIVNTEKSRLIQKATQVDQEYPSKVRAVYMNNNIQKRYNAYLKILVVMVISLVIMFLVSFISRFFPIISPMIINTIHIIILSIAVIVCIGIYTEIQTHDEMNYDKLKFKKTLTATSTDTSNNSAAPDSSSPPDEFGRCGDGTYLNNGVCTIGTRAGFTEMTGGLQSLNTYEFTNYSRY